MTTPSIEDFQKFSKQQLEAVNAAATTVAKGLQEIAAESSEYSKKAFAASSAVVEKLLGAKSVETAIQIQTEYRQVGLRRLRRPGEQDQRDLRQARRRERSSRSRPRSPACGQASVARKRSTPPGQRVASRVGPRRFAV